MLDFITSIVTILVYCLVFKRVKGKEYIYLAMRL